MTELNQKIDELMASTTKAIESSKRNEEEFQKYAADSAKALDELNQIKAKQEKSEELMKQFEDRITRANSGSSEKQEDAQYKNAMGKFLRKGVAIEREIVEKMANDIAKDNIFGMNEDEKATYVKTLVAGINPQGGYWIRPQRVAQMVERIFETSPMRQVSSVLTTNTDSIEMIVDDNELTSGGWVGETEARPETNTPNIGLLTIPVHEHYAQPKATQKMLDDAGFDIEGWLTRKVTDKLSREENTSFFTGNGNKKAKGILSYDAWASAGVYERDKIEQINSGTLGEITYDGLIELQNAVKEAYQPRAIFFMKRATWGAVLKLADGEERSFLNFNLLKEGTNRILLGQPVLFADDMPAIANNALAVAYGDFNAGYTIVDRFGFRVIRDEVTEKPYVKYYTTKRVGGAVTNFESFKLLKLAA